MDFLRVKMKVKSLPVAVILLVYFGYSIEAHNTAYVLDGRAYSDVAPHMVHLDHVRQKRVATDTEAPAAPQAPQTPAAPAVPVPVASAGPVAAAPPQPDPTNATAAETDDSNRTTNLSKVNATATPPAVVTQVPILGANGTGQRWANVTDNMPKVSDPISSDDDNLNLTNIYETPEKIQAEHHLGNITEENHDFYNSTFINNMTYFNEYWTNISKPQADVHSMLSNSHRRAITMQLSFKFPFYGNWIQNITVATGGFIYTGEHTHAWLAATQYIAPLMANFDTSLSNASVVKLTDDGEKFTAFWENVALRESPDKPFTFAVTLFKSGDIVFAYKNVPIRVQDIDDTTHPVKIGISDAYLTERVIFYVRRKTIYEYHRVSLKNHDISSNTILRLTALPTCLQYTTCDGCLNHHTAFDCAWCDSIKKCSSGNDRNKQDWQLKNCDKTLWSNASMCPAEGAAAPVPSDPRVQGGSPTYETDTKSLPHHETVVNTLNTSDSNAPPAPSDASSNSPFKAPAPSPSAGESHAGVSGVVGALLAVTLVCSAAAWALYAFKNPHTRSGQILIKYRPSQWSWRRGEARYTAATIHM